VFEKENGLAMVQDCEAYAEIQNFQYYYNNLKKVNLLRDLAKNGRDISQFYCENVLDPHYDEINNKFESLTVQEIINTIKGEVAIYEDKYVSNSNIEEFRAYDGIESLVESLQVKPETGALLLGDIFNTISRGARLGKLYLRSASSGVGKSRTMIGDCCSLAYPIRYNQQTKLWESTGACEKVVYIATEQDINEIQTMILAYLTGINEEVFLYGTFGLGEMDLIMKAIQLMKNFKDNLWLIRISDPCASIVKNTIRRYNLQHQVNYFFYDYIFSSPAMLNEYRDLKLPEYVCLRLFTTALKDLAVELDVFIMTSTQISNDDEKGGFHDYHHIQGAKAIVNLVDLACIMSRPTPEELRLVSGFQEQFSVQPNIVIDVFKNRRGRWTQVRIWGRNDLGICRRQDFFMTTADNKPIQDFSVINFVPDFDENGDLLSLFNDGVVSENKEELLNSFVNMVEKTQEARAKTDSDFYITDAFENKIDQYKQVQNKKIGDYF
jgi:replicative DNA helicase